jgi:hypothetical protein
VDDVKGISVAGAGRGIGVFGASDVEVVVAGVVFVVDGGRRELVPARPEEEV